MAAAVNGKNKGGAPPGNKNALKYGFYSRAYRREEIRDLSLSPQGELQDEIDLFRILIDRIARQIKTTHQADLTFNEYMFALHTLTLAISRLNSFFCTRRIITHDDDEETQRYSEGFGVPRDQVRSKIREIFLLKSGNHSKVRPRGGQLHNTNALKHGMYASIFKPDEVRRLEKIDNRSVDDEMQLLRILIKRTLTSMAGAARPRPTFIENLRALRVITFAGACLERLERTKWLGAPKSLLIPRLLHETLQEVTAKLGLK